MFIKRCLHIENMIQSFSSTVDNLKPIDVASHTNYAKAYNFKYPEGYISFWDWQIPMHFINNLLRS